MTYWSPWDSKRAKTHVSPNAANAYWTNFRPAASAPPKQQNNFDPWRPVMAERDDEIKATLEEARKAREEGDRLRREARADGDRLRREARAEAERIREGARRVRDAARQGNRHGPGFGPPPGGFGRHQSRFHDETDSPTEGIRTERPLPFDGVRQVSVDQTAGRLTVRLCQEGELPGIVSSGQKASPEITVQQDGDRLLIEVKLSKGGLFRRRHGATTLIRLGNDPLERLGIENGYGETELQGTVADEIHVNVGAGSLQSILTRGTLAVNVGAGKVAVLSHSGLARCDSGTGDVLLDIAEVFAGEYKVDVGIGRAEVRLPGGAQVFIKMSSGIGKSRIEYPSAPEGAPTRLRLNTGIGECVVKARDASASTPAAPVTPAGPPRPQRGTRAGAASRRREGEEMRVLQMLEQGKITPQDAADLIAALQGSTAPRYDDETPGPFS